MEGWLNHPVVSGAIAHAAGVADNASVAVAKIIIRSLPQTDANRQCRVQRE